MNESLFFWKNWNRESKFIYLLCLAFFFIVLGYFVFAFFLGTEAYFGWETSYAIEKIKTSIDAFEVGIFQFDIEANQELIFQNFYGKNITISPYTTIAIFSFTLILLLIILTILSFLNNWIYYFGTTFILGWLIAQQPNVLFIDFNYSTIIQLLPIVLIGGISYYFFAFNRNLKFLARFLIFGIITILYYFLILYISGNKSAVFYLYGYGSVVTIIISALFIALVSFEIVYGFIKLISMHGISGQKQGNSLHFMLIFFIYMANIVLQYLNNAHKIQFELFTFSPFILLIISSLLGIYGFRDRSVMFNLQLPFSPFGAVIYLCWAAVCFLTIGFYFSTGNDSMIEVFEDIIHLTHIGFGIGFFMYVILNYQKWLSENRPVAKLIFSHQWVSFYSVYGTGILIFLTLFFYSNMFTLHQAYAGYYGTVADAYLFGNEEVLAEEYYGKSLQNEFQNHKSNYTLANILLKRENTRDAGYLFKKALLKKPSPYAYANAVRIFDMDGQTLEAIFQLKKGIVEFPNSAELHNNLALLFDKINMKDSAAIYLNKSIELSSNENIMANKLAYFIKLNVPISDSTSLFKSTTNMVLETNKLAYKNIFNLPKQESNLQTDSILTDIQFSYLTNKFLSNPSKFDSLEIIKLENLSSKDTNAAYRSGLSYLKAIKYFYTNKPLDAVRMIDDLQICEEQAAAYYLNTIGLWSLKMGLYDMAADIFQLGNNKGDQQILLNKAIALAEAGKPNEAVKTLQITDSKDSTSKLLLNQFGQIYSSKTSIIALSGSDFEKYTTLHYRKTELKDSEIGNLFFGITNNDYKFKAGKDLFSYYFKQNEWNRCAEILNEISKLSLNNIQKSDYQTFKVLYFIATNDKNSLVEELNKPVTLTNASAHLTFGKAWILEQENNKDEAKELYISAANSLLNHSYIVSKCADFLAKNAFHEAAFKVLLNAVTLNAYDAKLYKFYTLQAIWYGIPSFAENGLAKVKTMVSPKEFSDFQMIYSKEKQAFEQKMQSE